jgi:PAS domain S-box-containing protein
MALVAPDSLLLRVNDAFCRLLGFKDYELKGRLFLEFTHPEDVSTNLLAHTAVVNKSSPLLWLGKWYLNKDGQIIWYEVSSSPVFDSKGCMIYTIAHIQDITERKKAEAKLKETLDNLENLIKKRTN